MSSLPDGVRADRCAQEDASLVADMLVEYERSFGHDRLSASRTSAPGGYARPRGDSWLLEEAGRPWRGMARAAGRSRLRRRCRAAQAMGRGLGSWLVEPSRGTPGHSASSSSARGRSAVDTAACELFEAKGYREVRRH